ncbi:unnamed protein product [Rotaria sp. Silwood1]|nr:unnamed protein product [Rotaria sp. Silwood1]
MSSTLFSTSCFIRTKLCRLCIYIDDDSNELSVGTNNSILLRADTCEAPSSAFQISRSIRLHFESLIEEKKNASTLDNDTIPRTILLNNILNIKLTAKSSNEPNSSSLLQYFSWHSSKQISENHETTSSESIQIDLSYVHISESFIWTVKRLQLEMDSEAAYQFSLILTEYLSKLKHRPRHLVAFVNPHSGKGVSKYRRLFFTCSSLNNLILGKGSSVYEKKVLPLFEEANINVKTIYTTCANHARDYISEQSLDDYDGLVSVGGDGMFSELCHGLLLKTAKQAKLDMNDPNVNLMRPNLRIGVIPAGSTDAIVFGTTGYNDPITSALQIIVGESVLIDIATVHNEHGFVRLMATMFSYGFFGNIIQQSDNWRLFGPLRYDLAGFCQFLLNSSYHTELIITQPPEKCNSKILINNIDRYLFGNSVKRQDPLCKQDGEKSPDNQTINDVQSPLSRQIKREGDGSFDVVLVKSSWRLDFFRFLHHVAKDGRTIDDLSNVERYRATEVIIRPTINRRNRLGNWACDGELITANEVRIRAHSQVLNLFASGIRLDQIKKINEEVSK